MPEVGGRDGVLGGDHLGDRRLLEALLALVLQPRRVVDHEVGLVAPHRDVGDVVLEDLELADLLAERLALLDERERVLEHAVEDAEAERAEDDPLVVERREQHVPRFAGRAEHELVGDEDVLQPDVAGAERAHAELRDLGDRARPRRRSGRGTA